LEDSRFDLIAGKAVIMVVIQGEERFDGRAGRDAGDLRALAL
jgi:hypothetical protein